MRRLFLVLAAVAAALLGAAALSGVLGGAGASASRRALHERFGLMAALATPALHCLVYAYFLGTGRWIAEQAGGGPLAWAGDLADRNARRVTPFLVVSTLLVGAAAWLGLGARSGATGGLLHLAASTGALAFTLGTFGLSYMTIAHQVRLIDEIDARRPAAEVRAESEAPAASTPEPAPSSPRPE